MLARLSTPWTLALSDALGLSAPPPIHQAPLRQLDRGPRGFLGLLVEPLKREQHLAAASLLGKQNPVDDAVAVDTHLPNVPLKMARGDQTVLANFCHARQHSRSVVVGQAVDELFDRAASRRRLVIAPASANWCRTTAGG